MREPWPRLAEWPHLKQLREIGLGCSRLAGPALQPLLPLAQPESARQALPEGMWLGKRSCGGGCPCRMAGAIGASLDHLTSALVSRRQARSQAPRDLTQARSGCSTVSGRPRGPGARLRRRGSRCAPPLPSSPASRSPSSRRPRTGCASGDACGGRQRSTPGTALNVAACSVTTRARSTARRPRRRETAAPAPSTIRRCTSSCPRPRNCRGGADHHLQVMLARRRLAAVEHPLPDAIDQHDVRQRQSPAGRTRGGRW